jgi:iron complex outermembrane receptor protein
MSIHRTIIHGCVISGLTSGWAWAQPQSQPPGQDEGKPALEEIIVTAERRAQNLQTVPVTISAFSVERLENSLVTRTEQLADFVPNMSMRDGVNNPSTLSVSLRGQGEGGGGIATSESPVAFYVDDIYQARLSGTNIEFSDIERIEVLRGPQGTLFGRNSMVGAVNVITATPGDDTRANASASYGNYDTVKLKGAVSGPVVPGALALSLSGMYSDQSKGFWTSIATGRRVGKKDSWGLRGKLHLYSSEVFTATLAAYYTDANNDGFITTPTDPVTQAPLDGSYFITRSPLQTFGDTTLWGVNGRFTAALGEVTLKSITAYATVDDGFRFDLSGGVRTAPNVYRVGFDRTSQIDQDQWTQEVQLLGDAVDGRLDWIVGGYFFTEEGSQIFTDLLFLRAFGITVPLPVTTYTMTTKSYSGFAQIGYDITDRLRLSAGGRYTDENKDLVGRKGAPVSSSTGYNAFTPKVSVDYRVTDDIFVFANAARGFKAGGWQGLAGDAVSLATPFNEETAWNYEIGTKSDLFDGRARLNVTAFLTKFKDLQTAVLVPGTANAVTRNGIDMDQYGLEIEGTVVPAEGLNLFVVLGFQGEKFRRIDPLATIYDPVTRGIRAGVERIPGVSHKAGSIGFTYTAPLAELGTGVPGNVRIGADFNFRDHVYADVTNTIVGRNSAQSRLNGYVGYESEAEDWQLNLAARNITDEVDWVNGLDLRGLFGQGVRQAVEPFTWMLEFKYRY